MGRQQQQAPAPAPKATADTPAKSSLGALINEAIAAAPNGPARGALIALETALAELRFRATSVKGQLGADHAPILERIQSL